MTQDEFIKEVEMCVEFEFNDKILPTLRADMIIFTNILFMAHQQGDEAMKTMMGAFQELTIRNFKNTYLAGALSGMTQLAKKSGEINQ